MGISGKKGVRFLGKVYGSSQIHEGFSVGLDVDEPVSPIGMAEYNGILHYVRDADDWFFNGYDLHVGFDEKQREPEYNFIAQIKESNKKS